VRGAAKSQPHLGKRTSGAGLEIFLESHGALLVVECNVCLDPPRPELRSMRNLAGVMLFEPGTQVVSQTDIECSASRLSRI
jgi:hypothetical protein